MSGCYLSGEGAVELWRRCKMEFGRSETADAEEVSEMLDEVFGTPSGGQTAADAEVEEMLNDVFGSGRKMEV